MLGFEAVLSLDGEWRLYRAPQAVVETWDALPRTEPELAERGLTPIPAVVPGNAALDYQRAGLLDDLLVGSHIIEAHKLEDMHYWYVRRFTAEPSAETLYLQLEGVDTYATVYLNGQTLGQTENMLMTHHLEAVGLLTGENECLVHLEPTVLRARREELSVFNHTMSYSYDSLNVRKAPYMFGWDIMPRLVSAGLWKSVSLVRRVVPGFTQCYLYTRMIGENRADMTFFYTLELGNILYGQGSPLVRLTLDNGEHTTVVTQRVWGTAGHLFFAVADPKLWWPRGYGDPFLYRVTAELLVQGEVVHTHHFTCGIRTTALIRRNKNEQQEGAFTFVVNGRPLFLMGTNWVPLDPYPSRHGQRLERALALVEEIGCNALRCWGGNVYESEEFYRLCDEKGFVVWQDFAMACAAYPLTDKLLKQLEPEIRQAMRALRQHPCICLWAGDNESDLSYYFNAYPYGDPNRNTLTRKFLPTLVMQEDYARPFLPTSPYYDENVIRGFPASEDHLWGERTFFDMPLYTQSQSNFVSEIGYQGCVSPASAREFLDPEHLIPDPRDEQWLYHASAPEPYPDGMFGYRIALMDTQIRNLTGERPADLETYALYSQISQAEAFKLFVERFRSRMGYTSGIIWWNIIDGCPQFSDAVVDYYYRKKLAFHYIQTAQRPVLLCIQKDGEDWHLYGINDTDNETTVSFTVEDVYTGSILLSGGAVLPPRKSTCLATLLPTEDAFCAIRWQEKDGAAALNHAYVGQYPLDMGRYIEAGRSLGLLKLEGF